jgi:hypothetical protein
MILRKEYCVKLLSYYVMLKIRCERVNQKPYVEGDNTIFYRKSEKNKKK